ncbi:kinase-like domain-containing protein [Gigaspora rosea]|uniref:Kinase-like domain-containing protein n=1 Tax=Gigaspora rosea TaxID=44941 RepID=A0A397U9B6_9GLOM|nr:kinase-like domain-containing protein [Gigaspora rosea]
MFGGKKYALKSLNNNLYMDDKTFKQFKREIKVLYKVKHPNIIEFYGASKDQLTGNFMMVLQFANGGNLQEYLQTKINANQYKISWNELIKIAKEITSGLDYLHSKKIIHQDLHSMNVLLNDGVALITDFGVSKQLDDSSKISSASDCHGRPAYIEPKCCIDSNYKRNEKSDIYSLGVLFWELTSGIQPFHDLSSIVIYTKIVANAREKEIAKTPINYVNLYKKCWDTEPHNRPTLKEILKELEKLSEERSVKFIKNKIKAKTGQ